MLSSICLILTGTNTIWNKKGMYLVYYQADTLVDYYILITTFLFWLSTERSPRDLCELHVFCTDTNFTLRFLAPVICLICFQTCNS